MPVRIQAAGYIWAQAVDGTMLLNPTDELLVYPIVITLQPGEARPIRIGTTQKSTESERSFRVLVTSMPLDPLQASGQSIAMRSRVNIPVFLSASQEHLSGSIEAPAVHEAGLTFDVRNNGTTHFSISKARVTVSDAKNSAIATADLPGWYVLPGDRRPFTMPLAPGVCKKAASVTVEVAGAPFISKRSFTSLAKQCVGA